MPRSVKRGIWVVVPAYNCGNYIGKVFSRIPKQIWSKIRRLVVINDGSTDHTHRVVIRSIKKYPKIYYINQKINQGYAATQKLGFRHALTCGADIVVLLHGDGQYAPEILPHLLDPLIKRRADIVQGSRILGGQALNGHMPVYKYIANRILSSLENWAYGMNLKEYHSGYMLYSRKALTKIPFEKLSNTFHFDGEMLFMGNKKGLRIKELPIPTSYEGQKSHVKSLEYGLQVLRIIWHYKIGKYDF